MKLLGAVNFNQGRALIVDERKPVTYECRAFRGKGKYTADLLIGDNEDGLVDVLQHQVYSCGPKAFGGHEFTWNMKDGSMLTTDGWWWSGGYKEAEELLGKTIISMPISPITDLHCFVFCSASIFADSYHALIDAYTKEHDRALPVYDYALMDKACRLAVPRDRIEVTPEMLWQAVLDTYKQLEVK